MENNKKTQTIWIVTIIIVLVGLLLISSKKGGDSKVDETADLNASASTTEVVTTPTLAPARTATTYKKPAGNVVELTAKGFSPFILEIKRGESVEFLNSSNKAMIIRSSDAKPENVYPGFSQASAPLGKGGKFYFGFTTPGAWAYYNLNSPADQGVIIVK